MTADKTAKQEENAIHEKAKTPVNPSDNWSDVGLRRTDEREKGPAEKE